MRRNREGLGLTLRSVYDLTLFFAVGVLIGGRFLIVAFNEWDFYREFPHLIPSIWVGGFATHGLIVGGAGGVVIFCLLYDVPVRRILDMLAISAAVILGFGRIGNFIDGQIYGTLTDLPWACSFQMSGAFVIRSCSTTGLRISCSSQSFSGCEAATCLPDESPRFS